MHTDHLTDVFREDPSREAVVWRRQVYTYDHILAATDRWRQRLTDEKIPAGAIVSLEADFSIDSIALLLALVERNSIVVPLTKSVESNKPEFREIAQVEYVIDVADDNQVRFDRTGVTVDHEILTNLKQQQRPGLVLFSSGSTGKSKAAVHDFVPLLEKFKVRRHTYRTLSFLLFDHIGGMNTLFYNLSNAGCIVVVEDRSPDAVCEAIDNYKVELLPTSPTFINLMLVSGAYERHDISSLKLITYGTEIMPESTLQRVHDLFPDIRLLQTYGLSEVGILRSKSRSSDSLWVKVGGEGFETRVVDGMFEIKAQSAMLGYLNAPSPFTEDGWFKTGDAVEVDGEYVRFLGRKSELINVGGEKVYPAEVESVIQTMDGVDDVAVSGESHPISGQIVKAKVKINTEESAADFRKRLRAFCKDKLTRFKVPQKIVIVADEMHGERFKKMRR